MRKHIRGVYDLPYELCRFHATGSEKIHEAGLAKRYHENHRVESGVYKAVKPPPGVFDLFYAFAWSRDKGRNLTWNEVCREIYRAHQPQSQRFREFPVTEMLEFDEERLKEVFK